MIIYSAIEEYLRILRWTELVWIEDRWIVMVEGGEWKRGILVLERLK